MSQLDPVAASPEGSAGNLRSLIELALETCDLTNEDVAIVRAAIPGLIDASRERDTERNRAATYWTHVLALEDVVASQAAQLTDARSRISELETAADLADKKRHDAFDQLEALRSSREQAITAIEALPRYRPGDERESGMVSTQSGLWLHRSAVLSILRGAE